MRSVTLATVGMALAVCVTPGQVPPTPAEPPPPVVAGVEPEPASEHAPAPAIPSTALAVRPLHEGRVLISVAAEPNWAAMPIMSFEQIE